MLLIEHREAVENPEEILQIAGVDIVFIAAFDLSLNYGSRDGPATPRVQEAISRAAKLIRASKVNLGGLATDAGQAGEMIKRGYRLIAMEYDTLLIERAVAEMPSGIDR